MLDKMLNNNKLLYEKICKASGIESEEAAAKKLRENGYLSYKNAQSVKNRFRSSSTRTDFFWALLDVSECRIEVLGRGEKSRKELQDEIEILKNEISMSKLVNSDIDLLENATMFATALSDIHTLMNSNLLSSVTNKAISFKELCLRCK